MIVELLSDGKRNAISTKELCRMVGVRDVRTLRAMVAKERKEGAVILSSKDGGYWKPGSLKEVENFIRVYDQEAKSILLAVQSARKYLKAEEGKNQCSLLCEGVNTEC